MPDSFRAFVDHVQPHMHNLALALTGGDVQEAEDLVQSSFERIWLRWGRLRIEEPRAYARTVVAREFSTTRRRVRWRRERLRAEVPSAAIGDFADSTASTVDLLALLARLPRRQRQVIVLRYLEDMSIAEVADTLATKSTKGRDRGCQ